MPSFHWFHQISSEQLNHCAKVMKLPNSDRYRLEFRYNQEIRPRPYPVNLDWRHTLVPKCREHSLHHHHSSDRPMSRL